jgi:hypothetical protein
MTNNYLRHPSYADYPVVGVNWFKLLNSVNGELIVLTKLSLEGLFEENAKTNMCLQKVFNTDTYLAATKQWLMVVMKRLF